MPRDQRLWKAHLIMTILRFSHFPFTELFWVYYPSIVISQLRDWNLRFTSFSYLSYFAIIHRLIEQVKCDNCTNQIGVLIRFISAKRNIPALGDELGWAKYCNLSVVSRSMIDLRDNVQSRYSTITEFNTAIF